MSLSLHQIKSIRISTAGILICAITVFASGCATMSTTTSAKNMTRPVMVGPVQYVKSDKKTPLYKKQEFDITVENSVVTSGGQHYQSTYITRESSEKIDAELMRKLESPQDKVVVENLFLKSARACFIVFCNTKIDYSGIEGGIYSATPVSTGGAK